MIDDAGPLTNQPLAHAVQCLQIKLLGGLGGNELHSRTLNRLGDCLCVPEVVLLALRVRAHVLRRHQPGVVSKRLQLAAEMMRSDAGLHADQACGQLANRASTWPRDHFCRSTSAPRSSWPTTWNEFLPISMPMAAILELTGDMACSLSSVPHASFYRRRGWSTAGPSHYRTSARISCCSSEAGFSL